MTRSDLCVPSAWEGFISPLGDVHECSIRGHEEYACELLATMLGVAVADVYDNDVGIGSFDYACDYLVEERGWALVHACGSCDGMVWVQLPNVVTEAQREALLRLIPALDGLI